MNQNNNQIPVIQSVLHPTDFSEGSQVAFYHALRASLLAKSALTLLHVASNGKPGWSKFPGVRETLERWGLIPEGSPKSAVKELGILASKVIAEEDDPVEAVLAYLGKRPSDLLVLATRQPKGYVRWLHKSVAEPVARRASQMTLFIPGESKGFVSAEDGSVSLNNVLIPIAEIPNPQMALEAAARLITGLKCVNGTFTLLHVSQSDTMPDVHFPEVEGWEWKKERRSGEVIKTILDTASEINADLIVMSTDGRNGFLDVLRGSHSERIIRQCAAPLLTIPVGSFAETYLS